MVRGVSAVDSMPFSSFPMMFPSAWLGFAATLAFLAAAFWTASRPAFRKRYLALPLGLLAAAALLARSG